MKRIKMFMAALLSAVIIIQPFGILRAAAADQSHPITRAEFSQVLDNWLERNTELLDALGASFGTHLAATFYDVSVSHPYYAHIRSVYGKRLVDGDAAYFRPDDAMTRQEVCESFTALFRALTESEMDGAYFARLNVEQILERYADNRDIVNNSQIANSRLAAAFMIENGYIGGHSDGFFKPNAAVTHAEAVSMLLKIETGLKSSAPQAGSSGTAALTEGDMRITRVQARNFTSDGFELEITVSRAAAASNAEVLIAPSAALSSMSSHDVERLNINRASALRLSHMTKVVEHSGHAVYSMKLDYAHLRNHNMFVMLKSGDTVSNIERSAINYIGDTGGGAAGPIPGPFDNDIVLYDAVAYGLESQSGSVMQVRVTVNSKAVEDDVRVIVAYTTDRAFTVHRNNIGASRDPLTSTERRIGNMRDVSPSGLINEYTSNIDVREDGTYQVYVMLRSGNTFSVIKHIGNVVVGSGTNDEDIALLGINSVDGSEEFEHGFVLNFTVNEAAVEKNARLHVGFMPADKDDPEKVPYIDSVNFFDLPETDSARLSNRRIREMAFTQHTAAYAIDIKVPGPGLYHVFVMLESGDFFTFPRRTPVEVSEQP
ncbi:MAG: S-layer homology domain-containing protein [Defluviitaleaceae bacterium]|nr:S-layer homology domain-containing protein [Defluviitaleaceae bacterium]MCL2837043.1 S-layer homology domain-containing protein [Defluviitaleaceae bacterium]